MFLDQINAPLTGNALKKSMEITSEQLLARMYKYYVEGQLHAAQTREKQSVILYNSDTLKKVSHEEAEEIMMSLWQKIKRIFK